MLKWLMISTCNCTTLNREHFPLFFRVFRQFLFSSVGFSFNCTTLNLLCGCFLLSFLTIYACNSFYRRQVHVDLEIKNTLLRLRKEARVNTMVVARQQALKELTAHNMENQPLCINIDNNANFELKSGFIHLLPIFNGLAGEDPHTHLKEFHMVCDGMKPNRVDEEHVKLKAFPFSLKG